MGQRGPKGLTSEQLKIRGYSKTRVEARRQQECQAAVPVTTPEDPFEAFVKRHETRQKSRTLQKAQEPLAAITIPVALVESEAQELYRAMHEQYDVTAKDGPVVRQYCLALQRLVQIQHAIVAIEAGKEIPRYLISSERAQSRLFAALRKSLPYMTPRGRVQ